MELTIYNTYVVMESQEQCDRMKQLCIDNELPIWENRTAFNILMTDKKPIFCYQGIDFFVFDYNDYEDDDCKLNFVEVTEEQFIELLKSNN